MAVAPHKLSGGAQWSSVEEARWGQPAPHAPVELSLILDECSKSVSEVADCLKGSVSVEAVTHSSAAMTGHPTRGKGRTGDRRRTHGHMDALRLCWGSHATQLWAPPAFTASGFPKRRKHSWQVPQLLSQQVVRTHGLLPGETSVRNLGQQGQHPEVQPRTPTPTAPTAAFCTTARTRATATARARARTKATARTRTRTRARARARTRARPPRRQHCRGTGPDPQGSPRPSSPQSRSAAWGGKRVAEHRTRPRIKCSLKWKMKKKKFHLCSFWAM